MEIWKDVVGFEGLYKVSNTGKVMALNRIYKTTRRKFYPAKIMVAIASPKGYLYVKLCNEGIVKKIAVHRLVAFAFCENPESKPHVDHIDQNPQNNNSKNLRWVTNIENQRHSAHKRTGLQNKTAKLLVHSEYGFFCTVTDAAKLHGCCTSYMSQMILGKVKNRTKFLVA